MEKTISRYRVIRTGNVSRAIENHMYPTQYLVGQSESEVRIRSTIVRNFPSIPRILFPLFVLFFFFFFSNKKDRDRVRRSDGKKNMTKIWTVSSNRILIFSPKILNVARSHGDETKQLCRLHKMADMSCSSPYLDFASISLHESPNVTR